jgi:opacity protein-like surface antigen
MKQLLTAVSIALLLTIPTKKAFAQYYFYDNNYYDSPIMYELGASVGFMNCLTDLGGRKGIGKKFIKDLNMGKSQLAGSIFLSALYKNALGIRVEASFGTIKAEDAVLRKVKATTYGRYERNLSFRSNITDFMVAAEIHPLYIIYKYEDDREPPRFSPYLLGGIGFFSFKPQAQLNGAWIDLQPLSTEGQGFAEYPDRKPYKLSQVSFPLGLGVKYELSSRLNIRGEFVYRVLSTDYLDDVSTNYIDVSLYPNYFTGAKLTNAFLLNDRQYELDPLHITNEGDQRGNPKNNDAYFTFNIKVGLTFGRERIKR